MTVFAGPWLGRRYFFVVLMAIGLLVASTAPGRAATVEQSKKLITWLGDRAIQVLQDPDSTLEKREAVFRDLLREGFALSYIGRFVLGRSWRKATPQQRTDYLGLFGEYVVKTYADRLGAYAGETFSVEGARSTGKKGDVMVTTLIKRPGKPPLSADWRVREIKGKHKIIDVMVEGVSMAVTQRQDFAAVTRDRGVDGLIEILRNRVEGKSAAATQ